MSEENSELFKRELSSLNELSDTLIETQKKIPCFAAELTPKEEGLLSVCFKNTIKAVKIATLIEQKVENKEGAEKLEILKNYHGQIEKELRDICSDILNFLEEHLIPNASTDESGVFYQKMKGDYHRYLSEFTMGTDFKDADENMVKLTKVVDLNVFNAYSAYINCSKLNDSLKKRRYDETFNAINKLGSPVKKLTKSDLNLINIAFKDLMKNRKTSWKIIASIEQELRQVLIYLGQIRGQIITAANRKDVLTTSNVSSSDVLLHIPPAIENSIKLEQAEDCDEAVETMKKIDIEPMTLWEYAHKNLVDDGWIAELIQLAEEEEDAENYLLPESACDNRVNAKLAEDSECGINEVAKDDMQTQLNNLSKMFQNHKKQTDERIADLNERISSLEREKKEIVPRVKKQHLLIKLLYSIAISLLNEKNI